MNSVLNPEAPEFYPHLSSFTQGAYKSIQKTILASNAFPSGESYKFFKTFSDFDIVTCQLSENVVIKSNKLIIREMPAVRLKKSDVDYNTQKIVDINDRVLDRIEINMNSLNKSSAVSSQNQDDMKPSYGTSSWNYTPIITTVQLGSTTFLGAKNIPRPQLNFKDPIDNTDSLWVPKISDKPNNIKPLALNIIYNDRGEAVGYEHPYKVELSLYKPPPEFLEPESEPPSFPAPMEQTKFTYIDTESQVDQLVEHLSTVKELAVDVEHHSYRTYQGITCLIQISTDEGGDFIIDTLAVREHIHKLNLSFTDPKKLKVFHGADMDVLWLQRDFGVYIVGLFDTYRAARALKMSGLALKNLLKHYCNIEVDKKYQLADWRIRPLPSELIDYARLDTHYLLYVWRRMKAALLSASDGQVSLRSVFELSKAICGATYNKLVVDETSHLALYVRSKRVFNSRQMAALRMLYRWRDAQARLLDESVTYLIPNHMMLALAEALPREMQGVSACCTPMPPFVKQNIVTIHRMLLSCRELPLEPVSNPCASTNEPFLIPVVDYDLHDIEEENPKHMRDDETILDTTNNLFNEEENEINHDETHMAGTSSEAKAEQKVQFVSNLNVDAQMYVPPYLRFRGYRHLAQDEEIKDMETKEAKIIALAQGDELIKAEVLQKLQESKNVILKEKQKEQKQEKKLSKGNEDDKSSLKKAIRKRKMSTEQAEPKSEINAQQKTNVEQLEKTSNNDVESKVKARSDNPNTIPFDYKNVNYIKYRHNRDKSRKEPKMKFKKHK